MFILFLFNRVKITVYIFILFSIIACNKTGPRFQVIKSSHSGIHFINRIVENDSVNQLDNGNIYNGGGVGIGDFNSDGLPDIFFTGNMVACKLYLNKGDFRFKDVTEESNTGGEGKWCRGVAVIDINNDGRPDIYISATISNNPDKRKNILYINQGPDNNNVPHFIDMASEYGLDDNSHTTQATFFDYDNDGDIDIYLTVNEINDRNSPYIFHPVLKDGTNSSTGRLYRNDRNISLNHPVFTDVSKQAGIQTEGYGNQASIVDVNMDGWKDIYISNDYMSNDLLWINNKNGTFSDEIRSCFKHTSNSAMGNDVGDINNDGLMDFITLDMNPEDNYRKKMMLLPASYQFYQNTERYGYGYQYTRNTLQLNDGLKDSTGVPVFSEIAYFAGIEGTDWSWTPLLADFDNDGYKDLFIANGFPRDITDHDFGMYRMNAWQTASKSDILKQVPEVKLHNYLFRNNGDLTFTDKSRKWGLSSPTFSNGAAYADLDNDGDLDLVVNNINDEALLYRNNDREQNPETSHFLELELHGDSLNINGLGAIVKIYYDKGIQQAWENSPFRGYLSTVDWRAHFGLGNVTLIDSMVVCWQNGKTDRMKNIKADQLLELNILSATNTSLPIHKITDATSLFKDVTDAVKINYVDTETDFVDFNIQKLLPHKFSEYGPCMAAGDIDGNGLDDIIIGGSSNHCAQLFFQKNDGTFVQKPLLNADNLSSKSWDDMGMVLFDADGDGDSDLYITSGGYENAPGTSAYMDHFYVNDGKGNFTENNDALPLNLTSKGCVKTADFDRDGDPDLFISGRVNPWNYPKPVSSFIYRNDSKNGKIIFTDITEDAAPDLLKIGMVSDALFTDFNKDGWPDLVLAGEWMPVTMLVNEKGKFKDITATTGIGSQTGWWTSIAEGDFDNDGDIDYIVGNLGLNSYYRANKRYPVSVYAGDFDNNGSYDAFPALYLFASQEDTTRKNFPAQGRDDIVKEMIQMRSKFQNYKSFARATIDQLFSAKQLEKAQILKATEFSSSYCRNDGNNKFSLIALPAQAQFSILDGMVVDDFNGDGNPDVLINTNDFGTEVLTGRYDALNGLILLGRGHGEFSPLGISESGIFIPGNGKALVKLKGPKGEYLVAAAQNRGPLKVFELIQKKKDEPKKTSDSY
jgi:hypothetical protein